MAKVIITAEVEDLVAWEKAFRSHGDLFKRQTVKKPISISTNEGNEVALIFRPKNLEIFMKILETEGPTAMANDGVKQETVKIFVLDKKFKP